MAKVTPVLWKHKENAEGRSPIYLRIAVGNTTKYKSLRLYIKRAHWNGRARRVRKSHKRHGEMNALITRRVSEAQEAILEQKRSGQTVTAQHIKDSLAAAPAKDPAKDFFAFAGSVIRRLERQGKIYTFKRYKSCVKKFKAYAGAPLPFDEFTTPLLRDYETHLIEDYGNARSTVASNLRALRAILYRAIRDGLARQEDNPFFNFTIKRGSPDRDKLTAGQLRRIAALELEPESLIWHVRGYFLFAVYAAGVRFGDVAKLRRRNILREGGEPARLVYKMSKTGRERSVKLLPKAREIARHYLQRAGGGGEDWLFPMLEGYDTSTPRGLVNAVGNQNALVNKYLKKIAERAELRGVSLSFHVARHSFATIAQQGGWDVAEISQALGHADLKVTEHYLKGFDDTDLDDKMDNLFGGGE